MFHELKKENLLGDLRRVSCQDNVSIKNFAKKNIPFIVTGIAKTWKAHQLWDLEYFDKVVGHKTIHCVSLDEKNLTKYEQLQKITFSEFITELKKNIADLSPVGLQRRLYLVISRITAHKNRPDPQLPELLKDIEIPQFFPRRRLWTANLWVGAGNNKSNLHFDPDNNILVPIKGTKKLILISPTQGKILYRNMEATENRLQSKVDVFKIDREQYPKIDCAQYYQTEIQESEGLYIPAGWWHAVTSSPGLNIAVNFWWLGPVRHLFSINNPISTIQWSIKNKWISIMFPLLVSKYFKSQ